MDTFIMIVVLLAVFFAGMFISRTARTRIEERKRAKAQAERDRIKAAKRAERLANKEKRKKAKSIYED